MMQLAVTATAPVVAATAVVVAAAVVVVVVVAAATHSFLYPATESTQQECFPQPSVSRGDLREYAIKMRRYAYCYRGKLYTKWAFGCDVM